MCNTIFILARAESNSHAVIQKCGYVDKPLLWTGSEQVGIKISLRNHSDIEMPILCLSQLTVKSCYAYSSRSIDLYSNQFL